MTNGEFLQSVSMETLAEMLDRITGACPEGSECSVTSEDELKEDACALCWKAWLMTERDEE